LCFMTLMAVVFVGNLIPLDKYMEEGRWWTGIGNYVRFNFPDFCVSAIGARAYCLIMRLCIL